VPTGSFVEERNINVKWRVRQRDKKTGLLYEQGSRLTDGRTHSDGRVIKLVGLYSAARSKTENVAID
jgi:ribosomal protein S16